jgi:hypothetical protein
MDRQLVIDLQGYKVTTGNKFIVKELALYAVNFNFRANFVVKSPKNVNESETEPSRTFCLNLHRIPWHEGHVSFRECLKIVKNICRSLDCCLYVKGSERRSFLKSRLKNISVVDLDHCGCPKYNVTADAVETEDFEYSEPPDCYYIRHIEDKECVCALKRAWFYGQWMRVVNKFAIGTNRNCSLTFGENREMVNQCKYFQLSVAYNTKRNTRSSDDDDDDDDEGIF